MRAMKDSGVEWIGEIPESWDVSRIKQLFFEVNDRCSEADDYALLSVSEYYGVAPRADKIGDDDMLTHAETLEGYKICLPNDIVINIMLAWKRALGASAYRGIVSPAYCVYRAKQHIAVGYYHYLFRTQRFADVFKQYSTGIIDSRLRLYTDKFFSLRCQVPPLADQNRIVIFLDAKCAQIDAIIEKQQQVIEKLKAYKQSVITEAVTKGLDPTVPMKDSGVEWIGKVPENWNIGKTLYALSMAITDGPHETPDFFDSGIPFISAEAISGGEIDFSHMRGFISGEYYQECCKKYIPQLEDIYMIKSGATTGRVAMVKTDEIFTIWSPLAVFRCNRDRMLPQYLYFFLKSDAYLKQVENKWSYGTQQNIGMRALEKLLVCFPPLEIQRQVGAYLVDICDSIDSIIGKKEQVIDRLTDYKKSLIYEAVTGKMEV